MAEINYSPNPRSTVEVVVSSTTMPVSSGTATTTPDLAVGYNIERRGLTIRNTGSTNNLLIADNSLTLSGGGGFTLGPGENIPVDHTGEVWVMSSAATTTWEVIETVGSKPNNG